MEGEVVAMTVGVAERSTVLLVGGDIVNMTVEVTGRYALSRVCLAGGGTMNLTVGAAERSTVEVGKAEGVNIVSMVAEVTEGVTFSVCFVHA